MLSRLVFTLIYEFIIPTEFIMFLGDMLGFYTLAIIFYKFLKNLLRERSNPFIYRVFTWTLVVISFIILLVGLILFDANFRCGEKYHYDNVAMYMLHLFVFFTSLLNLGLTIMIIRKIKDNDLQNKAERIKGSNNT